MSDAMVPQTPPTSEAHTDASRSGAVARLRAEADRATEALEETRAQFRAAVEARRGGPVTSPEDAATTMARLRASLEQDVTDLRARLAESTAPRTAGLLAAGVAGLGATTGILVRVRSRRSDRRDHEAAVDEQARALARALERLETGRRRDTDEATATSHAEPAGRWPAVLASLAATAVGVAAAVGRRRASDPTAVDEP